MSAVASDCLNFACQKIIIKNSKENMYRFVFIALASCFITLIAAAQTQDTPNCSEATNERAERLLENVFSEERWVSRLESESIDVPSADELRVMTNEQDPEACAEIGRGVGEDSKYDFYLYTAGSYYFAVGYPRREDGEWTSPRGMLTVYDENREAMVIYVL